MRIGIFQGARLPMRRCIEPLRCGARHRVRASYMITSDHSRYMIIGDTFFRNGEGWRHFLQGIAFRGNSAGRARLARKRSCTALRAVGATACARAHFPSHYEGLVWASGGDETSPRKIMELRKRRKGACARRRHSVESSCKRETWRQPSSCIFVLAAIPA